MGYPAFDSSPTTWRSRVLFLVVLLIFVFVSAQAFVTLRSWTSAPLMEVESNVVELRAGAWLPFVKISYVEACVDVELPPLTRLCERFLGTRQPFNQGERVKVLVKRRLDLRFRSGLGVRLFRVTEIGS